MKELVTISSKGQIVIPKKIRENAELKAGDQLMIEWDGNDLSFRKVEDEKIKPDASLVRELLGKYRTDDPNENENDIKKLRENLYGKIDD